MSENEQDVQQSIDSTQQQEVVPLTRKAGLIALGALMQLRWDLNPKQHQDDLIAHSIRTYGFNDPVQVDLGHRILCVGHGRVEALLKMYQTREAPPRNILVSPTEDWLVPCEILQFDTLVSALQYALLHNRSATKHMAAEDYDTVKLQRALSQARSEALQGAMPGFGEDDLADVGIVPIMELPPLPTFDEPTSPSDIFDASKLPDAPGYQVGQAPQSLVIMVTAPSFQEMLRMLRALSLGTRNGLPPNAKFCSVDGVNYVERWEAALLSNEQREHYIRTDREKANVPTTLLPGQLTLAGEEVTDVMQVGQLKLVPEAPVTMIVPNISPTTTIVPPMIRPLVESIAGGKVESAKPPSPAESLSPWGDPEPFDPDAALSPVEQEILFEQQVQANVQPVFSMQEPKWVGKLCGTCGGSGFTGYKHFAGQREKVICVECGGAGDRDTWLKVRSGTVEAT